MRHQNLSIFIPKRLARQYCNLWELKAYYPMISLQQNNLQAMLQILTKLDKNLSGCFQEMLKICESDLVAF